MDRNKMVEMDVAIRLYHVYVYLYCIIFKGCDFRDFLVIHEIFIFKI